MSALDEGLSDGIGAGWEEIIPFSRPARLPPFPTHSLPRIVQDMVREVAEARQVPEDLPGVLALGVLAAAGGGAYRVRVDRCYSEPLNNYVVSAMGPGERKSATMADVTAPLYSAEAVLQADAAPRISEAKQRRAIEDERLKRLHKDAANLSDANDRANAAAEALELAKKLTEVPAEPRLIVGDITPEKMAEIMSKQRERLAVVDAEGSCLFEVLGGRYSKNGEPPVELFLRAHAGDPFRGDRVGRESIALQHPALTLVATVQPYVLRGLAKKAGFRERGLVGRLLFSLPASLVGTRLYRDRSENDTARTRYHALIQSLALDCARARVARELCLSKDALVVLRNEADRVEIEQGDGLRLAEIRDWASKLAGALVRMAGCLHLAEETDTNPERAPIAAATMEAAVNFGRYFEAHALEAFALMDEPEEEQKARRVLEWVLRGKIRRFSERDVRRDFGRGGRPVEPRPWIRRLELRNMVRPTAAGREISKAGRRPSESFDVNPQVFDCIAPSDSSDESVNR
jgi:hypothetical protein